MDNLKAATNYISTSLHDAVKLRIGKQGLAAMKPQTIPQFFRECCEKYANLKALTYDKPIKRTTDNMNSNATLSNGNGNGNVQNVIVTYEDYFEHVRHAAMILLHVGLEPRSSVAILSFNCPEWFYIELGALFANGVVAGIYPSSSAEAVFHALDNSEATVCVVDDREQMEKVRAIKSRLPRLRAVIQLHGPYEDFVGNESGYYRWSDLEPMKFDDDMSEELDRREQNVGANDSALLIFTV